MKNLLKKVRGDKKGFTLAELLVVVAIVGILVAISVPLFTAQLGKARQATNNANLRAAKVAAVAQYLTDGDAGAKEAKLYTYDIKAGTVDEGSTTTAKPDGTTEVVINENDTKTGKAVATSKVYDSIYVVVSGEADASTVTLYAK